MLLIYIIQLLMMTKINKSKIQQLRLFKIQKKNKMKLTKLKMIKIPMQYMK